MTSGISGILGLLLAGGMLVSNQAAARQPLAQSGHGTTVHTSAGECWRAADGEPGFCGDAPDLDGDGVTADIDQCPDTAAGASVDSATGCPPDTDRDGVADAGDACPGTRYGVRVDTRGCALDLDKDGVPYFRDRCHLTPPGAEVNAEGCMAKVVIDGVRFGFDRYDLTPAAKQYLMSVSEKVKKRLDIERIRVTGHTDSIGSHTYNQRLSERRAGSVQEFLRGQGVTAPMAVSGKGETRPVADNGSTIGRAQNRRVEIDFDPAGR